MEPQVPPWRDRLSKRREQKNNISYGNKNGRKAAGSNDGSAPRMKKKKKEKNVGSQRQGKLSFE